MDVDEQDAPAAPAAPTAQQEVQAWAQQDSMAAAATAQQEVHAWAQQNPATYMPSPNVRQTQILAINKVCHRHWAGEISDADALIIIQHLAIADPDDCRPVK